MNKAEKLELISRGIELLDYIDDSLGNVDDLKDILYQLGLGIERDPIHPDTDCVFNIDGKWLAFDEQDIRIVNDIDKATIIPYKDILIIIEATDDKNRVNFWNGLYYYKSTKEFILRDKIKVAIQEID